VKEKKTDSAMPRKRLFITLMGVTCLILVGVIFLAWWVPNRGLANIHPDLPHIVGVLMAVLSGIAMLGTGLLVLTTALGKDIFLTRFMRLFVIKFLLPLIETVGRIMGVDKERIRQSFIAMNNSLVMSQRKRIAPDRILVLLPHCTTALRLRDKSYGGHQQVSSLRALRHKGAGGNREKVRDRHLCCNRGDSRTEGYRGETAKACPGCRVRA